MMPEKWENKTNNISCHALTSSSVDEVLTVPEMQDNSDRYELAVGDHIYSWRAAGTWSHHGIVLSVSRVIAIVDFFPEQRRQRRQLPADDSVEASGQKRRTVAAPRVQLRTLQEWKVAYGRPFKVFYKAGSLRRLLYRSGTCTGRESDPTHLVVARVRFLLGHFFSSVVNGSACFSHLPHYHRLHSNSETAAFWCKTGYWATLQVADFLHITFAGQIKSSITIGAYASTQAVADPVSGAVGATMASAHLPVLLPLVIGYGLITVGGPLWMLRQCQSQCDKITLMLHEAFWSLAPNNLFVECIQYWTHLDPSKVDGK